MLKRLLLFSTVLAIFAIPMFAARDRSPRRGLRKAILLIVAFNVFYWFAIRFIYPHL